MGFRINFIGFTGMVQILLALTVFSLSEYLAPPVETGSTVNNANGSPLWGGIIIILCGASNVVHALANDKKKEKSMWIPISLTTSLANLCAFIVSVMVIGFFSWAMSSVAESSSSVNPFSTVIIAYGFICVLSLVALFVDCFTLCLPDPHMTRPYHVDHYDAGPRYPQEKVFMA